MIVYYSSATGNTKRFVEKFDFPNISIKEGLICDQPFILFTPTFADTHGNHTVPKPVIRFLNEERNRNLMLGVVGFGNRNFGRNFAIASEVISSKCQVPLLYKVELFGNNDDILKMKEVYTSVFK